MGVEAVVTGPFPANSDESKFLEVAREALKRSEFSTSKLLERKIVGGMRTQDAPTIAFDKSNSIFVISFKLCATIWSCAPQWWRYKQLEKRVEAIKKAYVEGGLVSEDSDWEIKYPEEIKKSKSKKDEGLKTASHAMITDEKAENGGTVINSSRRQRKRTAPVGKTDGK